MLLAKGSHFLLAWFPWIYGGISNYFGKISTNSSKVRAGKSSTLLYSGFTLKIIYEIVYGLALLNYKRGDYFSSKTSLATAFLASPSSKRSSISRSSRPIRPGLPRPSVTCNFSWYGRWYYHFCHSGGIYRIDETGGQWLYPSSFWGKRSRVFYRGRGQNGDQDYHQTLA